MKKQMSLADFLDMFSWSQADLSREAGISPHCVSRALNGERISRRNAQKIVEALDYRFQAQGPVGHITMGSITGLQLAELQHKKPQRRNKKAARVEKSEEQS